jgi:ABC-type uncharacterized transport system permease subunit
LILTGVAFFLFAVAISPASYANAWKTAATTTPTMMISRRSRNPQMMRNRRRRPALMSELTLIAAFLMDRTASP